jgi:hypothetical protein
MTDKRKWLCRLQPPPDHFCFTFLAKGLPSPLRPKMRTAFKTHGPGGFMAKPIKDVKQVWLEFKKSK